MFIAEIPLRTFGWSLMEATAKFDEIRDAFRWKEKWRFIDVPEYHAAPLAGPAELGLLSSGTDPDSHRADVNVLGMAPEAGVGPRTAFGMALAAEADQSGTASPRSQHAGNRSARSTSSRPGGGTGPRSTSTSRRRA